MKVFGESLMNIMKMYPTPHPQTAGRVIDGEAVLILADNSEVNVLNEVGTRIFELSNGNHSTAEIVAIIVTEYEVTPEQAEQDTREFLNQMVDRQVLTLRESKETDL
jgi:hypothetical protein